MSTATAPTSATARGSRNPAPEPETGRRRPGKILLYVALVLLSLLFISPLIYMVSTSFKTTADAASTTPQWIPAHPTTQAYESIFTTEGAPVVRWLVNSLAAATLQTALVLVTASMAAYALARIDFPGKRWVFG